MINDFVIESVVGRDGGTALVGRTMECRGRGKGGWREMARGSRPVDCSQEAERPRGDASKYTVEISGVVGN